MIFRIGLFILLGSIAALLGYWTSDRAPPVVRSMGVIVPDAVKPGDMATVRFAITEQRNCPGIIQREITSSVDHIIFRLADVSATYAYPTNERLNFAREITIPRGISYGPAKYRSCVVAVCNPVHYFWPIRQCDPILDFIVFNGEQ